MQGPHRTILTYFWGPPDDESILEVGEVSCVPRKGDVVYLLKERYVVEQVSWTPDPTMFEEYNRQDMAARRPLMTTWVAALLKKPTVLRKK